MQRDTVRSRIILVLAYNTTLRHNREEHNWHVHRRESLAFQITHKVLKALPLPPYKLQGEYVWLLLILDLGVDESKW